MDSHSKGVEAELSTMKDQIANLNKLLTSSKKSSESVVSEEHSKDKHQHHTGDKIVDKHWSEEWFESKSSTSVLSEHEGSKSTSTASNSKSSGKTRKRKIVPMVSWNMNMKLVVSHMNF